MKRKKDKIKNEIEMSGGELIFSNRYLVRLLWPLFVEQFLLFAVGLLD